MKPEAKRYWWTVAAFLTPPVVVVQLLANAGVFDRWPPWLRVVLWMAIGALFSELADMWMKRSARKNSEKQS